jgi:hypothetical protein
MPSVSSVVGSALGAVFRLVGAVRPAAKPLHPTGAVRPGTLRRYGAEPPVGVPFLDSVGTDDVVVRLSRAAGLPRPLPDVHGLALRVPNPDGSHGDVLFSTTGFGRWTRFLLVPSRSAYSSPMTTLLPYDTAAGPVLLGVRPGEGRTFELVFSIGDGPWRPFGELALSEHESEEEISFDAVRNTPPGLAQYDAVRRIREPAYEAARSSRGED